MALQQQHHHLDDDDEGDVCRICRSGGDERLYHPCRCSGSIRHVHASCLTHWLQHSGNTHCEVRVCCAVVVARRGCLGAGCLLCVCVCVLRALAEVCAHASLSPPPGRGARRR